tara:strand:- start:4347 stop:4757 length:411 start_codon:yes stop_codon:yes gene_type:complete
MRTGSYVGRIDSGLLPLFAPGDTEMPVLTLGLPEYACEVRFRVLDAIRGNFGYSFDSLYDKGFFDIDDDINNTNYVILPTDTNLSDQDGNAFTRDVIIRSASGLPRNLFIFPTAIPSGLGSFTLEYQIIGGKNNGY